MQKVETKGEVSVQDDGINTVISLSDDLQLITYDNGVGNNTFEVLVWTSNSDPKVKEVNLKKSEKFGVSDLKSKNAVVITNI